MGSTKAFSSQRAQDGISYMYNKPSTECSITFIGKWDNMFTAFMVLTNTGYSDLAITNMEGYYCTTGGDC